MKRNIEKIKKFPNRELNPGLSGESRVSWPPRLLGIVYMLSTGIEPATLGLWDPRAANCATKAVVWDLRLRLKQELFIKIILSTPGMIGQKKCTLGGARTHDHKIKSLALYHLSYGGQYNYYTNYPRMIGWPSGLRRQFKALVSSGARVRISSQSFFYYQYNPC